MLSRVSLLLLATLVGCQSSGDGVPIVRSPEHFNQLAKEGEALSREGLTKYENGLPLSQDDQAELAKARMVYIGLRDYAPAIPNNHLALGKIARALQDDIAAQEHFAQVVALLTALREPSEDEVTLLAESYGELSRILLLQGRVQDAGEQADYARQLRPEDPRYQIDQASVLIQAGREKEAKALLAGVLKTNPGDRRARGLYGLIK